MNVGRGVSQPPGTTCLYACDQWVPGGLSIRISQGSMATMYVIHRKPLRYLAHDDEGQHTWTDDVLDAARFDTYREAKGVTKTSIICNADTAPMRVGLHGHFELYRGYLVQIMRDGHQRWRVRYGLEDIKVYKTGKNMAESPNVAMKYGKSLVDNEIAFRQQEGTNGHRKAG